jgi:ribosome maturation protein SDO1
MPDMLVRLKRGKTTFEVLTSDGSVTKFREKELKSLQDVLVSGDEVYTDLKKGSKASKELLVATFETDNLRAILEEIVLKGDVQLSAGERKDKLDAKRQEVIAYIHKNYVDPGKGTQVPMKRVELALDKLRPRIDADQPADRQVAAMMGKLVDILPLRKGNAAISGVVTVPSRHMGAASGVVRKYASVTDEQFGADGAKYTVQVFEYETMVRELARVTKGEYEFAADGISSGGSSRMAEEPEVDSGRKKKKGKGKR